MPNIVIGSAVFIWEILTPSTLPSEVVISFFEADSPKPFPESQGMTQKKDSAEDHVHPSYSKRRFTDA